MLRLSSDAGRLKAKILHHYPAMCMIRVRICKMSISGGAIASEGNQMDVHGKVVIITCASMGIGLSTARRFAAEGAKLVLAARSVDLLAKHADELTLQDCEWITIPTDATNQSQVNHLIDRACQHHGRNIIASNTARQPEPGAV